MASHPTWYAMKWCEKHLEVETPFTKNSASTLNLKLLLCKVSNPPTKLGPCMQSLPSYSRSHIGNRSVRTHELLLIIILVKNGLNWMVDGYGYSSEMITVPCPMNGSNSPSLWQRNNLGCMTLPNFEITLDLCRLANHQNWYLRSARHSIERWAVTSRGKSTFTVFPLLYTFAICFDPDYHDASSYCLLSPSSLYHLVWPCWEDLTPDTHWGVRESSPKQPK